MCNSFNMNYPSLYTDEYIHVTFIINNVLYVSTILISEDLAIRGLRVLQFKRVNFKTTHLCWQLNIGYLTDCTP